MMNSFHCHSHSSVSLTNTAVEGMSGAFPLKIRDAVCR
jgi:hypothetical protein